MRKTIFAGMVGLTAALAAPALAQTVYTPAGPPVDAAAPQTDPTANSSPADPTTTPPAQAETASGSSGGLFAVTRDKPFNSFYVGAAAGLDANPNRLHQGFLFDRNLDGRYGDTVLTSTGENAFSPGFCNGAARGLTPRRGCQNDHDALGYYGRVGVDHQIGHFAYGVVAEFGKTNIRDSQSAFSTAPDSYVFKRTIKWEGVARARAGYVAGKSTLFYGTLGAGIARIDHIFYTSNTINNFTCKGKRDRYGYVAGGGVEQMLGDHFSIGLEYLYHRYKDDTQRVTVGGPLDTPFTNALGSGPVPGTGFRQRDERFVWHSFRATAAFHF